MSLDGIGKLTHASALSQVGKVGELSQSNLHTPILGQSSAEEINFISYNAENLPGFEKACANFSHLVPRDIDQSFTPQCNIDPAKIPQSELDKTNRYWAQARGQPEEV